MSYTAIRSGFTGPSAKIGGSTAYHQDLKLLQSLPINERVKIFDTLALQNQQIGREIEFSNPAVSGRRWNPGANLADKVDLLEKAALAHGHSQHPGWQSFDYYTPFKGKSRFEKGAVEDASIYVPGVAGGKIKRASGGGYGYYSESMDPSGRVIARVGHGNIDRPEPEAEVMVGQVAAPVTQGAQEEVGKEKQFEDLLKAVLLGASLQQEKPQQPLESKLKSQLVGQLLQPSANTDLFNSLLSSNPYMSNPYLG